MVPVRIDVEQLNVVQIEMLLESAKTPESLRVELQDRLRPLAAGMEAPGERFNARWRAVPVDRVSPTTER